MIIYQVPSRSHSENLSTLDSGFILIVPVHVFAEIYTDDILQALL
jgi:hypothetical protein